MFTHALNTPLISDAQNIRGWRALVRWDRYLNKKEDTFADQRNLCTIKIFGAKQSRVFHFIFEILIQLI